MREVITAPNAAPRPQYHSRSQAWNSASLQGSESSRMCAFMQALMRPCPGVTSLQNCLMSGLHVFAAAIAPGRICAIAPDAENNKMAHMMRTGFSIVPLLFCYPRHHRTIAVRHGYFLGSPAQGNNPSPLEVRGPAAAKRLF